MTPQELVELARRLRDNARYGAVLIECLEADYEVAASA